MELHKEVTAAKLSGDIVNQIISHLTCLDTGEEISTIYNPARIAALSLLLDVLQWNDDTSRWIHLNLNTNGMATPHSGTTQLSLYSPNT